MVLEKAAHHLFVVSGDAGDIAALRQQAQHCRTVLSAVHVIADANHRVGGFERQKLFKKVYAPVNVTQSDEWAFGGCCRKVRTSNKSPK